MEPGDGRRGEENELDGTEVARREGNGVGGTEVARNQLVWTRIGAPPTEPAVPELVPRP